MIFRGVRIFCLFVYKPRSFNLWFVQVKEAPKLKGWTSVTSTHNLYKNEKTIWFFNISSLSLKQNLFRFLLLNLYKIPKIKQFLS